MPPEGANALVESYRTAFRECLSDLRPASLLKLRGELQVVIRWLEVRKQDSLQATGEAAVDAVSRFYQFGQEIGGFAASGQKGTAQLCTSPANRFPIASFGLTKKRFTCTRARRATSSPYFCPLWT